MDTRIFFKECVSLAKEGYDLHLVITGTDTLEKSGVHFHGIRKNPTESRLARMTKTLYKVARTAHAVDAQVYHFHDPELIPLGFLLKLKGKKVIYDAHEDTPRDLFTRDYIPAPFKRLVSGLVENIEKFCGKRFDAVVAATPHIYERYKALGAKTVCVNNYPISTEFFNLYTDRSRKEKAFCYVGAIARERGIFELIEALPLAQTKLYLGGSFSEKYQYEEAIKLKAWKHVVELGQINRVEVGDMFARSVGGIVTFHPEQNHIHAQPNKLFEYMSAAMPVIASDFPGWRSIITENRCGLLVDPLDPQAVADAMMWIMDNPEESEAMGKRGREAVQKKYNWNNEFKKLKGVYEHLCGR